MNVVYGVIVILIGLLFFINRLAREYLLWLDRNCNSNKVKNAPKEGRLWVMRIIGVILLMYGIYLIVS